jgi:tRNA A37 threonylcarbamoyladenosine dehydratase
MEDQFSRTEMLLGENSIELLGKSRVAVFGVGGVGGYAVEALARSGVGALDLVDNDEVCLSNINRQIIATHKTLGKPKVEVAKDRVLEINPNCEVKIFRTFYTPETAKEFDFSKYDYIIDAIDTVSGKISLIEQAKKYNIPIICAMGAGNKLDPTKFEVADISKTSVCPLARVIRTELKKRKIKDVKVVYSKEIPKTPENPEYNERTKKQTPGSISFVPSVVGLIMAGEVIKDLANVKNL